MAEHQPHHGSLFAAASVLNRFPASLTSGGGGGLGSPTTSVHEREEGWASSWAGGNPVTRVSNGSGAVQI